MLALRLARSASSPEAIAAALAPRGRFWLDGHPEHPEGRWAFLGSDPIEVRMARFGDGSPLSIFEIGEISSEPTRGDARIDARAIPAWIGYVAYDAAWSDRSIGLKIEARHPRGPLPVAWIGRYDRMIAMDLARGEAFALGEDDAACEAIASAVDRSIDPPRAIVGEPLAQDRELHRAAIDRALDAIGAGEIYQVNLARAWRASFEGDPLALFAAMRGASPVPLGFFLELEDHAVLARTMERFLRWDRSERDLWTSPIKGTIARGGDDAREANDLRADDKERAEHSMIVDLMRNDLSRVAEIGSVRVEEPLRVEPFAGLSHLVSTVRCKTREDVGPRAILEATFPPGSITGTPKLRAMEIIEALEPCARGIYTGALGYVDRAGGLSLAVAIRTAVVHSNEVVYYAGGGLVSASDPDREIAETELKAKVFFDALKAPYTRRSTR